MWIWDDSRKTGGAKFSGSSSASKLGPAPQSHPGHSQNSFLKFWDFPWIFPFRNTQSWSLLPSLTQDIPKIPSLSFGIFHGFSHLGTLKAGPCSPSPTWDIPRIPSSSFGIFHGFSHLGVLRAKKFPPKISTQIPEFPVLWDVWEWLGLILEGPSNLSDSMERLEFSLLPAPTNLGFSHGNQGLSCCWGLQGKGIFSKGFCILGEDFKLIYFPPPSLWVGWEETKKFQPEISELKTGMEISWCSPSPGAARHTNPRTIPKKIPLG